MRLSSIVGVYLVVIACACSKRAPARARKVSDRPTLRGNVAAVCAPGDPLLLDVPKTGGYALNTLPLDSTRLAHWFEVQLARRVPAQRIVMVRVDSARRDELRWIIPAIERAGGGAYQPDSTCAPKISIRTPDEPAV